VFTKITNLPTVLLLAFAFSQSALAVSIQQAKGNRILLSLDGDKLSVGQTITLKNADDKTVATAVIGQVKGGKAIATVKTGKVDGSETVSLGAGGDNEESEENISPDSFSKKTKSVYRLNSTKFSGLLTIGMNQMNTKQSDGQTPTPNTEEVALKGNSFGLTGAMDYPFNNWLILRGTLGYEPLVAKGTSTLLACNNLSSTDCNASINYLSASGFARFNLTKSRFQTWVGVGGTAKFPISKTTTALRADDIKMTMTFGAGGGFDFFITNKTFIPASLEYQLFQSSETVSANIILIRSGFGWAF
jgi:outer membrane protein W